MSVNALEARQIRVLLLAINIPVQADQTLSTSESGFDLQVSKIKYLLIICK